MLQRQQGFQPCCKADRQTRTAARLQPNAHESSRHRGGRASVSTAAASDADNLSNSSGKATQAVSVADPLPAFSPDADAAGTSPAAAAGAAGQASSSKQPSQDKTALLARIAAAKAYKSGTSSSSTSQGSSSNSADAGAAAAAAAAAAAPPTASSSSSNTDNSQLTEEQQEAMRQQYLQQLQQQQQELAAQSSAYNSYVQQASSSSSIGGSDPLERLKQEDKGWGPGSATGPARSDFYTSADAPALPELLQSAPRRSGLGSANEAADWLKGVLADTGAGPKVDPNLRPEEITAAKEAAAKQRGADIITAFPEDFASSSDSDSGSGASGAAAAAADSAASGTEASAAAAGAASSSAPAEAEEEGDRYKPKVTTWGVFPRPQNISATYGGGRNIRPGQALETPQQKAQREADYAAALAKYKAATFTDSLSDEELAAAQARFNDGMKLFNRGAIEQALVIFDEVRNKVPLKSKLGGMSTLQAAVCYDTLGNGRQAEALYKRIQGHPTTEVGRKARQLVFGFQAMTFLKTEGLNYAVKKEDYLKYFRRSADRRRVYVASEEERLADAEEARKAAALAAGIVLGPVVMIGAMLLGK